MNVFYGFGYVHTEDATATFNGGLVQKSWYLDLLCKRDYSNPLLLGGAFSEGGKNVNIYILSTGVNPNSKTLKTRVHQLSGAIDTDGHGSALASIASGITYGIARASTVYGVTLDYSNLRTSLDSGITTVIDHVNSTNSTAVVLIDALEYPNKMNGFRFTNDLDTSISDSVQRLLDLNIPTVSCVKDGYYKDDKWLGNLNVDFLPPISTTDVMTFAGFDAKLEHLTKCNYGLSVFLYAPCDLIIIENLQNILVYDSHADYASAIGAGIAALCLSKNPNWGHKEVKAFLKKVSRVGKISNNNSYSNDAFFSNDNLISLDREGYIIYYKFPDFTKVTKNSVNPYFVKNLLELVTLPDLGEFSSNQTISIPLNIYCKTFYNEDRPFTIKIKSSDCSFLKIDSSSRLFGFVPKHETDRSYSISILINNGINAITATLTLTIKSEAVVTKNAVIRTLAKEHNWLDFNLTKTNSEKFNLKIKSNNLKTELIRPVSRPVSFYDHALGIYVNKVESSPTTGEASIMTTSDIMYAIVEENKTDTIVSNSKIIDKVEGYDS